VGLFVGPGVGDSDGTALIVGLAEANPVGDGVGFGDGFFVGFSVGTSDG